MKIIVVSAAAIIGLPILAVYLTVLLTRARRGRQAVSGPPRPDLSGQFLRGL